MPKRVHQMLAALALCGLARADTVELKDTHLKLEGKVHRETPEYIIFEIKKGKGEQGGDGGDSDSDSGYDGQIRILKSQIKSIEYDIATQLDKVGKDDVAGQYKVGVWAMERGMYADALKLFEDIKKAQGEGKTGAGSDLLKLMGQAYKERGELDKALESYSDYLRAFPNDTAVADAIKELKAKVSQDAKGAKPKIVEGLEADGTWVAEAWPDSNPGMAQIIVDNVNGNKMVAFQTPGGQNQKAAFSRSGQPLNLTESETMTCRIFNSGKTAVNLSVAFINSQGEFHETKPKMAQPESWTPLEYKIKGPVFKSDRNQFKGFDQELAGRERINRITFLVAGGKETRMYVDALFFK